MKKPALRKNRFAPVEFKETNWTKGAKNIGEYIFREILLKIYSPMFFAPFVEFVSLKSTGANL